MHNDQLHVRIISAHGDKERILDAHSFAAHDVVAAGDTIGSHIYTYVNPPVAKDLAEVRKVLENDGVIAYPSDVNWAFACDSASSKALERIRLLKPLRPKEQPFSLLCASISMASTVASVDNFAFSYMRRVCPGPYTLLLARSRNLPRLLKDKRRTVGIRIPACPLALAIVEYHGKPLATTSVPSCGGASTLDGNLPPKFGWQVHEVFGHAIDLTLDLGEESPAGESTIISLVDGRFEVIRQGLGHDLDRSAND